MLRSLQTLHLGIRKRKNGQVRRVNLGTEEDMESENKGGTNCDWKNSGNSYKEASGISGRLERDV